MATSRFLAAVLVALTLGTTVSAAAAENRDGIAVIVGNRTYRAGVPAVDFAHNDAEAIKRWVVEGLGFREGNIIDLRDAGKAQLEATFGNRDTPQGKLWDWVRPKESDVVVYYSGHGIPGPKDGRGYLLPSDADPDKIELNGYPLDVLLANLGKLPAKSVTVMLDACFSGLSPSGTLVRHASSFGIRPAPAKVPANLTVLTAASGEQMASWDLEAKHGLFTAYLVQAFGGEADKPGYGNGDGKITLGEIRAYLDGEMTYQARRRFGRKQTADIKGDPERVLVTLPQGRKTFRDCDQCPEMVVVPAGRLAVNELNRRYTLAIANPFAVGKYTVTFGEWEACVVGGGCKAHPDSGTIEKQRPVVAVSWSDAQTYVTWLTRRTGQTYRLLTKTEWEWASRAGEGTRIVEIKRGSEEWERAWRNVTTASEVLEQEKPDAKPPNKFGLHDIWPIIELNEWIQDCYHDDTGIIKMGDCHRRALSGGGGADQNINYYGVGFRVARDVARNN